MRGKPERADRNAIWCGITPADAGKTAPPSGMSASRRDHPRGCGENVYRGLRKARTEGSPPRMRGKLYRAAGIAEKYRITPADAGKTAPAMPKKTRQPDHPRGCGENLRSLLWTLTQSGSPPRMRGKPEAVAKLRRDIGITPADAGKTEACNGGRKERRGSPPRMRGKHETELARHDRHGITPADAGKTAAAKIDFAAFKDHPRGCGENSQ